VGQQGGPGDFLFVPAGVVHRFVNFTEELLLWVLFMDLREESKAGRREREMLRSGEV
jgi:mannose-6-phosphate isomerase-like protein (cupin superfamily)